MRCLLILGCGLALVGCGGHDNSDLFANPTSGSAFYTADEAALCTSQTLPDEYGFVYVQPNAAPMGERALTVRFVSGEILAGDASAVVSMVAGAGNAAPIGYTIGTVSAGSYFYLEIGEGPDTDPSPDKGWQNQAAYIGTVNGSWGLKQGKLLACLSGVPVGWAKPDPSFWGDVTRANEDKDIGLKVTVGTATH